MTKFGMPLFVHILVVSFSQFFSMSIQSVNYLVDSFGLNSYSVNQIACIFEKHGIPASEKEDIVSLQKFINKIISSAEKNGGETTSACITALKSIVLSSSLCDLEDCIVRVLDFSKSVVLYCPNWNSKLLGRIDTLL